jgi:hypothetical protein
LTIGLSIFNIALKELGISTAARQSIYAFYAADSGREYVLYRDTKKGDILPFDVSSSFGYSTSTNVTGIVDPENDSSGPNYSTTLTKQWFDINRTQISATIVSDGFDSSSGDRVGREIREDY